MGEVGASLISVDALSHHVADKDGRVVAAHIVRVAEAPVDDLGKRVRKLRPERLVDADLGNEPHATQTARESAFELSRGGPPHRGVTSLSCWLAITTRRDLARE